MRKLLAINLLVLAGLLAAAEVTAALIAHRQGEPLALVRLIRQLKGPRSAAAPAPGEACRRQTVLPSVGAAPMPDVAPMWQIEITAV